MVVKKYFSEILERIDDLLTKGSSSVIVAIDGNSGAGKSVLADWIGKQRDCNIFHMDHFFLTPELRTKERLSEPGGNIHYERFRDEVAAGLKSGREFQYRVFNCSRMDFEEEPVRVTPKRLNIVEGVYSMHPTLMEMYDLKIFLGIDKEEQGRRIMERSGPVLYKKFMDLWIPMEDKYFETFKIKEKCDLVYTGD
ncbi:MAG TPA: uridine kinase [Clostridiaceae bacterium]|nr:uridine kinase [Clostridiaceae bacterium]